MIGESAGRRDRSHAVRTAQMAHRRFDAQFVQQLVRRQLEHAPKMPLELRDREVAQVRERLHAHRAAAMTLQVRDRAAQAIVGRMAGVWNT